MLRRAVLVAAALLACLAQTSRGVAQDAAAAPVVFVETSKGTFAFETFPRDAPRTVAHIVELAKKGFYNGQRFHRALPGFLIQWGDPQSRDLSKQESWGRGDAATSGKPIGIAEITKRRTHGKYAVGVAHPGNPALADSQIYVTLADRPDLNGRYAVFGRIVTGQDVVDSIARGDVITKMYVKE